MVFDITLRDNGAATFDITFAAPAPGGNDQVQANKLLLLGVGY